MLSSLQIENIGGRRALASWRLQDGERRTSLFQLKSPKTIKLDFWGTNGVWLVQHAQRRLRAIALRRVHPLAGGRDVLPGMWRVFPFGSCI